MRATETHFAWLADSIAQLVCVVDAAGRLSYGNLAWHAFTGIPAGARFLESYLPAIHPEDRSLWRQTWEQAVTSGESYAVERRVRFTPDSEYARQLEWGRWIQESSGRSGEWIIIATDADEDERLIGELRRSIECKDKFFALAAHALRGPLAPISSALTHLGQHMEEAAVVNQSCAVLARQVAQLGRLVDELSDLVRFQSAQILLRRPSVDLPATIASAIEAALPVIASRGHDLTVVAPVAATVVDGDAGRLTQVFANLLVNAAKFTDNRGRICVSVEREPDWVLVKVRDSGMGITREMLPRVFDPYVQAERGCGGAQGGLGLGLALARHLIELHGGTVTAYSEGPGQGSEFVVRLPAPHGQECSARCLARTHSSHALT